MIKGMRNEDRTAQTVLKRCSSASPAPGAQGRLSSGGDGDAASLMTSMRATEMRRLMRELDVASAGSTASPR